MKHQSRRSNVSGFGLIRWTFLPASLVLGACSADPVDLGDGRLGVDRSALESYAAVWEGYVEAYEFRSGSDQVRLVLDERGNGTITFGDGEPLPEPTDPDDAFPFERFFDPELGGLNVPTPAEGHPYAVANALVEDERLRTTSSMNDIYSSACAIQAPVAVNHERDAEFEPISENSGGALYPRGSTAETSAFACVEEVGYHFNQDLSACYMGTSLTPISCSKAQLCNSLCECSETACMPKLHESPFSFDAALNDTGDRLEGTILGLEGSGGRATLRLTRVAAP
jgi:hypothetical protein